MQEKLLSDSPKTIDFIGFFKKFYIATRTIKIPGIHYEYRGFSNFLWQKLVVQNRLTHILTHNRLAPLRTQWTKPRFCTTLFPKNSEKSKLFERIFDFCKSAKTRRRVKLFCPHFLGTMQQMNKVDPPAGGFSHPAGGLFVMIFLLMVFSKQVNGCFSVNPITLFPERIHQTPGFCNILRRAFFF